MKILKAIIIILLMGISYVIGVYYPFIEDPIAINDDPISKGDYYSIFIDSIVAICTFGAIIVALFADEIRGLVKKVDFEIRFSNNNIVEDVEDIKGSKKAKRYHNSLLIINNGNINAQNCELYLEDATFTTGNSQIDLNINNSPICWNENKNTSVYIPSQGKKVLFLFSICKPQNQSTPDGKNDFVPPQLQIAGLEDIESKAGKWELIYCLYSTTSKPKKFKVTIEWDGNWEEREKEMKNNLTMKLENI